jgi:hypothetical protein
MICFSETSVYFQLTTQRYIAGYETVLFDFIDIDTIQLIVRDYQLIKEKHKCKLKELILLIIYFFPLHKI